MMTENYDGEEILYWQEEAAAIISDVKKHVALIEISKALGGTTSNIYLNLRTIEGSDYCVDVSIMGFRIVGKAFDTIDPELNQVNAEKWYETPYALLDVISPKYIESFGSQLCQQLLKLQQMSTIANNFNEEDEDNIEDTDTETT